MAQVAGPTSRSPDLDSRSPKLAGPRVSALVLLVFPYASTMPAPFVLPWFCPRARRTKVPAHAWETVATPRRPFEPRPPDCTRPEQYPQ